MSDTKYEVTVAIVFADISGSTALYERIGNIKAHEQISACLELLRSVVAENDGEFVHSRGDDVVCTFESPDNAFLTVRDMLARTDGGELLVHIGLDYGHVIRIRDDIFGDCVNGAARLSGLANSNEALCSHVMREKLADGNKSQLHFFDTRHLKGKQMAANIYRYSVPSLESGTQISFGASVSTQPGTSPATSGARAEITYQDQKVVCDTSTKITIGRAENCDMILPYGWISRQHAEIEMRNDHAYVKDVSSNGIYVCVDGQPPVLLRRETMLLPPVCTLSPTLAPDDAQAVSIECAVLHGAE